MMVLSGSASTEKTKIERINLGVELMLERFHRRSGTEFSPAAKL